MNKWYSKAKINFEIPKKNNQEASFELQKFIILM